MSDSRYLITSMLAQSKCNQSKKRNNSKTKNYEQFKLRLQ